MENQLNHLGIIPDGNTRWAKANNLPAFTGYRKGMQRVVELTRHARKLGIHTLTMWGLSTENWKNRPQKELNFLVTLFIKTIDEHIKDALEEGVRIVHLGNKSNLPQKLIAKMTEAEEKTRNNTKYVLNLALDYGGHDEIIRATKKIINDVLGGKLNPDTLGDALHGENGKMKRSVYSEYLDTAGQPYPFPDFIIRTSGEIRLSGFLPWQSVYSELHFEPCLFPDFSPEKLEKAIETYNSRKRRFGGGHK